MVGIGDDRLKERIYIDGLLGDIILVKPEMTILVILLIVGLKAQTLVRHILPYITELSRGVELVDLIGTLPKGRGSYAAELSSLAIIIEVM